MVIRFVATIREDRTTYVVSRQLIRSGTSIGANYREANRAESRKDFVHKIAIIEKESAETQYWLELCADASWGNPEVRDRVMMECSQLVAIFTRVGRTLKRSVQNDQ
jgi:four helix bundle protein